MHPKKIMIATRESPLALAQATWVRQMLVNLFPHLSFELLAMKSTADKMLDKNLKEIGGKGFFVKELEEALLQKKADIAVHSMKDLPMDLPEGLAIGAICKREDPRDVLLTKHSNTWQDLPKGAVIGTSSLRRQIQLLQLRPDLKIKNIRGNIQTRLKHLADSKMDALVLAAAGLNRLGLTEKISHYFHPNELVPPAGQGALGVECRLDDHFTLSLLQNIADPQTESQVIAERAFCRKIGGGCMIPIGSFAETLVNALHLRVFLANPKGSKILKTEAKGAMGDSERLGITVAEALLRQGAASIMEAFH